MRKSDIDKTHRSIQSPPAHETEHKTINVRSFVAVFAVTSTDKFSYLDSGFADYKHWNINRYELSGNKLELGFKSDDSAAVDNLLIEHKFLTLILGDDSEFADTDGKTCMASCAFLNIDLKNGTVEAFSSIVGLPPIFVYNSDGMVVIASSLHLLKGVRNIRRDLDTNSLYEMLEVGYPLHGRTLLKNVHMLTPGTILMIRNDGRSSTTAGWNYPNLEPIMDWGDFIDLQADAFRHAVRQLDVNDSFISLSGGLDTRTVFAALLERGVKVPASTLSGSNLSLDARISKSLCENYQNPHFIVTLDNEFVRNLPELAMEASRLSGGLASLEQAHEVYFYRQLQHIGSKRISGNLGNQVGRGGVEGTSLRNADTSFLNCDVEKMKSLENNSHWLEVLSEKTNVPLFKLLLQHEVPYTSVGNYCIGQHFAVQQSPYANLRLIEATCRRPVFLGSAQTNVFSTSNARLKDLRHRFFGEDPAFSFQQKVILSQGGFVAECPINWGWRVKGGVSLSGLGMGLLAFCDAYSGRSNLLAKLMAKSLRLINADGMHIYKQYNTWLFHNMSDFINDTMNSKLVTESGLLNKAKIDELLTDYFIEYKPRTKDLIAALDISLAIKNLCG